MTIKWVVFSDVENDTLVYQHNLIQLKNKIQNYKHMPHADNL